jgi:N-methylhydantoinase A
MPLDLQAATQALTELAQEAGLLGQSGTDGLNPAQGAALGVIQIANAHMERALRVISVERGYDPADFVLVSFGGAGGLHACDLARGLGIRRVLIPAGASTLSAFGMLTADVVKDYVQTVMMPGDAAYDELDRRLGPLAERGRREVAAEGVASERVTLRRELDMRYQGQSYELTVPLTPHFADAFHRAHHQAYGHSEPSARVEVVNLRLRAVGAVTPPPLPQAELAAPDPSGALDGYRPVVTGYGRAEAPFYLGDQLRPGNVVTGPATIVQPDTTIFLGPSDRATLDGFFNLVIEVER